MKLKNCLSNHYSIKTITELLRDLYNDLTSSDYLLERVRNPFLLKSLKWWQDHNSPVDRVLQDTMNYSND